jgi:hypothetical protein
MRKTVPFMDSITRVEGVDKSIFVDTAQSRNSCILRPQFKMSILSLENVLPTGGGVHSFSTWKSRWKWGGRLWKRQVIVEWSWYLTPSVWGAQKNENWRTFSFFVPPTQKVSNAGSFVVSKSTAEFILNCGRNIP